MDDEWVFLIAVSCVVGAVGGAAIGRAARGRPEFGAVLGVIFGPLIGWPLIFLFDDRRTLCPACKGALNEGAIKCHRCGADVGPLRLDG
jgi:hypothetical protein